jgi:hypothetical protein
MTKKLQMYFYEAQTQIKQSSSFLEEHANLQPHKQEKRFQIFFMLLMLFNTIYSLWFVGSLNMSKSAEMYYKIFVHLGIFFSFLPFGLRSFVSLSKAGVLMYKETLKREKPLTGLLLGTTALLWKYKAPVAFVCVACVSGVLTVNDYYAATYGFSISGEIETARHGDQTWEQAKQHILNPYEYKDSVEAPYIQDIKKENMSLIRRNKELEERINKIIEDSLTKK